jgi:gas vesicle protein
MNKNNNLTRFDEGGLHSQNPLGGVPIGNNNSVEQGESKQNNFVYSNRIFLDSDIVSQYNLPKSLIGKSVADATKFIDNKFKGRNDKISQSTKNGMLSKIAEAQEAMKPQEPEIEQPQEGMEQIPQEMMDNGQMALGGFANSTIGQGFGAEATGAQQSAAIGAGLGTLTTALDLGKTAFGKPAQDTSGLAASAPVNSGAMIGGSALKGAQAGMAFGPWGAAIGGVVGAGAGLLGANKAKKAAVENTNNYAINTNNKYSDNYFAMGGQIDPPIDSKETWNTKKIVNYQPGVTSGKNGNDGFYLFSKKQTEPGFNVNRDREFVNQENMMDLQRTPQWKEYQQSLQLNKQQPIVQFALGGKMNQMANGGPGEGTLSDNDLTQQLAMAYKTGNPVNAVYGNETNKIKNLQSVLGVTSDGIAGKNTQTTWDKYLRNSNPLNKSSNYEYPWEAKDKGLFDYGTLGLTPGGRQYVAPVNELTAKKGFQTPLPTSNAKVNIQQFADSKIDKQSFSQKVWNGTKAVGKYGYENAGNLARYAPIAANALQLAMLKKPESERLDRLGNRYKPEYVDEAQLQNIANQTMNNSVNAIGQSGASQGQLRSSIIGSQLQRTKAISDSYGQAVAQNRATNDRAQTFNLGVDQVNLQQSNVEKDNNARDQAAYRNAKREYITGIGEGIGGIGDEQAYKKIAKNTTGYTWDGTYVKTPDGNIVTNPATGKPMTQEELKQSQLSKDKKALGGYLIKNKVK